MLGPRAERRSHALPVQVGFIKPVGQQHVTVEHNGKMVRVDKDVQLMKECAELLMCMWPQAQPHTHTRLVLYVMALWPGEATE